MTDDDDDDDWWWWLMMMTDDDVDVDVDDDELLVGYSPINSPSGRKKMPESLPNGNRVQWVLAM